MLSASEQLGLYARKNNQCTGHLKILQLNDSPLHFYSGVCVEGGGEMKLCVGVAKILFDRLQAFSPQLT